MTDRMLTLDTVQLSSFSTLEPTSRTIERIALENRHVFTYHITSNGITSIYD